LPGNKESSSFIRPVFNPRTKKTSQGNGSRTKLTPNPQENLPVPVKEEVHLAPLVLPQYKRISFSKGGGGEEYKNLGPLVGY